MSSVALLPKLSLKMQAIVLILTLHKMVVTLTMTTCYRFHSLEGQVGCRHGCCPHTEWRHVRALAADEGGVIPRVVLYCVHENLLPRGFDYSGVEVSRCDKSWRTRTRVYLLVNSFAHRTMSIGVGYSVGCYAVLSCAVLEPRAS